MRGSVAVLVACSLVLAGAAVAAPVDRTLVVRDADSGAALLTVDVHEGSNVTLAYTHSVEKTPVRDIYTVTGTALDNTEMRFRSYGWGLPAREAVRLEDGWFVFDPDRRYEAFNLQPAAVAGHRLYVDGEPYDLVARSDDPVRISIERRPVLGGHTPQ
ncbi:DUF1850 domain-containing protein [Haloglomus litoreum]|uniref:DUF1850 domain-containing protein n=1 Tax=Haloglomus litoreum TaxID=3034026 RepID=UPI0023E84F96|nr:DUF1850 domain-containing protein [Haloglomus sp. DT116]